MSQKKWLISSILFSELGSSIFSFVLSLAVLAKTNSAMSYSTILVVSSVTSILATPLIGNLVDNYPKRRLLVLSQSLSVLSLIFFDVFLKLGGQISVFSVSLLTIFLDLSDIIYGTTLMTSAVYIVQNQSELVSFNSIQQSLSSLCALLGPLLAGAVYSFVQIQIFLYFEIFCELIAIACFFKLPYHQQPIAQEDGADSPAEATGKLKFSATIRYLLKKKDIFWLTIGMFLINFFMVSLSVGLPYVIFKKLTGNSFAIGAIEVAIPIGMIIASLVMPYLKIGNQERRYILVSWFICGALIAAIAVALKYLTEPKLMFASAVFLISIGIGIVLATGKVPLVTYMQKRIMPRQQGKVFSILDTLVQVAIPIGTALYGILFDHVAATFIFGCSGIAILGFTLALLPTFKKTSR